MQEADYRTDEEKLKDQIIEQTLRDVKQVMETRDLEDVELIRQRMKQFLLLNFLY